jgi:hypothetical protein
MARIPAASPSEGFRSSIGIFIMPLFVIRTLKTIKIVILNKERTTQLKEHKHRQDLEPVTHYTIAYQ